MCAQIHSKVISQCQYSGSSRLDQGGKHGLSLIIKLLLVTGCSVPYHSSLRKPAPCSSPCCYLACLVSFSQPSLFVPFSCSECSAPCSASFPEHHSPLPVQPASVRSPSCHSIDLSDQQLVAAADASGLKPDLRSGRLSSNLPVTASGSLQTTGHSPLHGLP